MQEFERILKSCKTRAEVVAAVQAEAECRVAKKGGSLADSEARVWAKHPEAVLKYDRLPVPAHKPEPETIQITKAEAELDSRARKIMKRDGTSYPQACSAVLLKDPSLYEEYCKQSAAGERYLVPVGKSNGGDAECENCGGSGMVGGRVCEPCNGFGTAEPDDDTEEAKKALFKKLDQLDDVERRILKLEAGLKRR